MTRVFGELGYGETGFGEMGHNHANAVCHQAVQFGNSGWEVTLFGWEGNRRPGGK